MILLSVGDRIEEGTYRLHSEFRRAVNFADNRRMVFLVDEEMVSRPTMGLLQGIGFVRSLLYPDYDQKGITVL